MNNILRYLSSFSWDSNSFTTQIWHSTLFWLRTMASDRCRCYHCHHISVCTLLQCKLEVIAKWCQQTALLECMIPKPLNITTPICWQICMDRWIVSSQWWTVSLQGLFFHRREVCKCTTTKCGLYVIDYINILIKKTRKYSLCPNLCSDLFGSVGIIGDWQDP